MGDDKIDWRGKNRKLLAVFLGPKSWANQKPNLKNPRSHVKTWPKNRKISGLSHETQRTLRQCHPWLHERTHEVGRTHQIKPSEFLRNKPLKNQRVSIIHRHREIWGSIQSCVKDQENRRTEADSFPLNEESRPNLNRVRCVADERELTLMAESRWIWWWRSRSLR